MNKILLDTDVVLDFFFDRKPFSEDSAKILTWCEVGEVQGFLTPVIIANCYYLLRKNATNEKVIEKLKQLISILGVLIIDKQIIVDALNSEFADFEDALQNFSAIKSKKIDIIVTRNFKDYKNSELAVFTPANFIKNKIIMN